jgi:CPSF A subunit region.
LSNIPIDYIVFGTIRGSIGVVAILPENVFTLLNDLQTSILADLPKGFGNNYTKWRSYKVNITLMSTNLIGQNDQ